MQISFGLRSLQGALEFAYQFLGGSLLLHELPQPLGVALRALLATL